ncbi:phosphatase PAP2 family protein [Aliidiomarina halalkaliphila]|uniref:undecaprenyl-diphosphate phosphatase n=1 Tax=Aliidiomarina halalkaliphila TaxID=2593535 RepID=A0A552X4Y0_9GAMM|nr:phosphatase PAP2 family protein [Aliidiomarina halalkaliphila]TRW50082.1 phosphatase PAP2 family protein [Aliidiomarina halalkaliphila]
MTQFFSRLRALDELTFDWLFRSTRSLRKSRLAFWLSRSGDGPYYALFALFAAIAAVEGSLLFIQRALLAFAIEIPLFMGLKNLLRRDRPWLRRKVKPVIKPADRFSFPSGHATAAFLFAALVIASFPVWAPLFYGWAALVAISRVALGVHYPSDVIAGAILGTAIAALVVAIL